MPFFFYKNIMNKKMDISVIIPVYNEESTCHEIINKVKKIDLVKEIIGVDMSKQMQSSDWGAEKLSEKKHEIIGVDNMKGGYKDNIPNNITFHNKKNLKNITDFISLTK